MVTTYPQHFGAKKGTTLAVALDVARGGHFQTVKNDFKYPDGAWYTYVDDSCFYNCMTTEYFYWLCNTALGALKGRSGNLGMEKEWKVIPADAETLKKKDVKGYELVTSGKYTKLKFMGPGGKIPDGLYAPKAACPTFKPKKYTCKSVKLAGKGAGIAWGDGKAVGSGAAGAVGALSAATTTTATKTATTTATVASKAAGKYVSTWLKFGLGLWIYNFFRFGQ